MTPINSSQLHEFQVFYLNSDEFHHLKREIFTKDLYYAEFDSPTPLIVDLGAHIGLSVLYFKRMFPEAKIIAVEPNPIIFPLLQKNVEVNQLLDVTLLQKAVTGDKHTANSGKAKFYHDATNWQWHSTASFQPGAWTGDQQSKGVEVEPIMLGDLLSEINKPVDLLKVDIEGAEQSVLESSLPELKQVKQIKIEFHPTQSQNLGQLLKKLEPIFDLELYQKGKSVQRAKARGLLQIEGTNHNWPIE